MGFRKWWGICIMNLKYIAVPATDGIVTMAVDVIPLYVKRYVKKQDICFKLKLNVCFLEWQSCSAIPRNVMITCYLFNLVFKSGWNFCRVEWNFLRQKIKMVYNKVRQVFGESNYCRCVVDLLRKRKTFSVIIFAFKHLLNFSKVLSFDWFTLMVVTC